jgi:3-hydroxyisobutyrate dehydrogenase-like beta-hydroxyacid dehydrogenase
MNQKIAVIGTGRMGSALASAVFNKGFTTTVWNRTAAKATPLAQLGLHVAANLLEAIGEADVVVVNISGYDSTKQLLRYPGIQSGLRGKILVQLTTGTPDEAREMGTGLSHMGSNTSTVRSWAMQSTLENLRSSPFVQGPKNYSIA